MRLLIGVVLVTVLLSSACIPKNEWPTRSNVKVNCTDFYENERLSRTLTVGTGETFDITLCSNQSTGFQWSEEAQINAPAMLEQEAHEYIAPSGDPPPPPGAPGLEVWTFKALQPGTVTIYLECSKPWEGGENGERTCTIIAVIK
jgi:inhibitor of cysteine peptidase